VNYLGEEGAACKLDAAVVVCNPWNLETCNLALQQSWIGLKLYSATMGSSMKGLFERHVEQLSKNPNIDIDKVRKSRYLHEFDRYVQCPSWGYPTEYAYYRDASSTDSVLAVRIPLLSIHAEDDPIAVDTAVPREEIKLNPNIVLCSTSLGGHLSWFELGGDRWFARVATNFLKQMETGVDWAAMSKRRTDFANGYLREQSNMPSYDPMRRKLHGASLPGA
jgi:predicted alpha/beta-fold hydrolase